VAIEQALFVSFIKVIMPDKFEMELFGVSDLEYYESHVSYWGDGEQHMSPYWHEP
jgi:hypothetical protein